MPTELVLTPEAVDLLRRKADYAAAGSTTAIGDSTVFYSRDLIRLAEEERSDFLHPRLADGDAIRFLLANIGRREAHPPSHCDVVKR